MRRKRRCIGPAAHDGFPEFVTQCAPRAGEWVLSAARSVLLAVAPEPYLTACMAVLYRPALACRMWGCRGKYRPSIRDWERCDIELLRGMLGDYERKWAGRGGLALLQIFDGIVAGESV